MLPTNFRFTWLGSFRGEDFLDIDQSKQELPLVAMFVNRPGRNKPLSLKTFHRCFLPSFGLFGQAVSEEENFFILTNQKKELPVTAMFINGSG
jgi:hypothetical protein